MNFNLCLPKVKSNNLSDIPKKQNINFSANNKINYDRNLDTDVIEICGTQTRAKVYTSDLDYKTYDQIKAICSHPVFKDLPIRIMPDVHPSSNTVVGFSSPMSQVGIVPGIIGNDIGCGMLCVQFDTQGKDIDFEKLNDVINSIVSYQRTKKPNALKKIPSSFKKELKELCKDFDNTNADIQESRLGTLGQGNHFIEVDKDSSGEYYLIIHTGSRNLGKQVAQKYDHIARLQNHYYIKGLSYLTGDEADKYLKDMKLAQKYAEINRQIIADEILYRIGWKKKSSFESIHNYIGKDNIIRKGAVSAYQNQNVIIPLNMRDGAVLAKGKGNKEWNYTAPHGAGRKMSRSEAYENITLGAFKDSMEGIYSASLCEKTIDEAPMAYKDSDTIIRNISDTVEIEKIIKPIFNYKEY